MTDNSLIDDWDKIKEGYADEISEDGFFAATIMRTIKALEEQQAKVAVLERYTCGFTDCRYQKLGKKLEAQIDETEKTITDLLARARKREARIAELEHMVKDINEWEDEVERLDAALLQVRSMICANSRAVEKTLKVIDKARAGK